MALIVKGGKGGTQSRDLQFPQKFRGNSPFKTRSQQPSYNYVTLNQSKWHFFKAYKHLFWMGERKGGENVTENLETQVHSCSLYTLPGLPTEKGYTMTGCTAVCGGGAVMTLAGVEAAEFEERPVAGAL